MKIEILGVGCPKCASLEANVKQALVELSKSAEVVKVTDINAIVEKGAMQTPALVIDGKIITQGKVPTVEQIKQFIER